MFAYVDNRRRRFTRHPVVALLIGSAFLILLLAAACASSSKEDVIREYLDCQAERDPYFEESMMIMFPAAENLEDAIDQYVYVSQAASMDDLEAARDMMCGGSGGSGSSGTGGSGGARQDSPPGTAQPVAQDNQDGQSNQGGQGRRVSQGGSDNGGCGSGKFPNADEIKDGQTVEGSIGRAGWDEYCFQAEEGGTYLFEAVSGTLVSPALQIGTDRHMEGPNELASGFSIAVFEAPSPDTYLLVVAADFGYSTDTGTYAVRMSQVEDDHANTLSNPTAAGDGQTVSGEIGYREDVDRFYLEVEKGRIYRVQMDSGGNEDIRWWGEGRYEDRSSVRSGDDSLQYQRGLHSGDRYYVSVRGARDDDGQSAMGSYSLTFSSYLPGEDDHGESAEQATPISAGETASGKIEYRGDIDFFRFQAEPGITYRVDVQFHGIEELEVYDVSEGDKRRLTAEELATKADIVLYDGAGREIGSSWELDQESIEWGAEQILLWAAREEAATYHISLEFRWRLPYDLTLTAIPDQPDQPEGAPEIKIGQSMDGSVDRGMWTTSGCMSLRAESTTSMNSPLITRMSGASSPSYSITRGTRRANTTSGAQ